MIYCGKRRRFWMDGMTEFYDPAGVNKPQKTFSPKLKRTFKYLLCIVIGIAVAVGAILLYDAIFSGAASPEEAVAEYQKAALLYDADGMIEYSSYYNKTVLYGNRETSDRLLKSYLDKAYDGKTAQYTEADISFSLISVVGFEKGEARFDEVMKVYTEKGQKDADDIKEIATVRMKMTSGANVTTHDYLVVKKGSRWYFGYAEN